MLYEFMFVVDGVDPDDDAAVTVLSEHLDASLARGAGVSLLLITSDGVTAVDAARNAMVNVTSFLPQITFLYLDRDLVGISEIAERTGRSRQNVTQWVSGERHAAVSEHFPNVEGVVGRARIWLWSEVNAWLRMLGLGDEIAGPRRPEITDIDFLIRHQQSLLGSNRVYAEFVWPQAYLTERRNELPSAPADNFTGIGPDTSAAMMGITVTLAVVHGAWYGQAESQVRPAVNVMTSSVPGEQS